MAIRSNFARGRVIALTATGCSLALTACGSSSKSAASRGYSLGVRYADCMRSHGVPNFPDPSPGGGFAFQGVNASSPAFQSAQTTCVKRQPGGLHTAQPTTGEQMAQMVAKARCIRRHGFPTFPDPSLSGNGMAPPSNWNPQAPASIAARRACTRLGIAIPGWGVAYGPVG